MCGRSIVILLFALLAGMTVPGGFAASPPKMRPYAGIGVVVFPQSDNSITQGVPLQLYAEPGLSRVRMLESSRISGNEWIFGQPEGAPPLIVSARKGKWLRVYYDDAGREAWVEPHNKGRFQTW